MRVTSLTVDCYTLIYSKVYNICKVFLEAGNYRKRKFEFAASEFNG